MRQDEPAHEAAAGKRSHRIDDRAALAAFGFAAWVMLTASPLVFGQSATLVFGWNAAGAFEVMLPVMAAVVGYCAAKTPARALAYPFSLVGGHATAMMLVIPPGITPASYAAAAILTLAALAAILTGTALLARFGARIAGRPKT